MRALLADIESRYPVSDPPPADPRVDACPDSLRQGHPRTAVAPHGWTQLGPRSYRGDYSCPRCGRSWWTSWGLGPRIGDEPILDDLKGIS